MLQSNVCQPMTKWYTLIWNPLWKIPYLWYCNIRWNTRVTSVTIGRTKIAQEKSISDYAFQTICYLQCFQGSLLKFWDWSNTLEKWVLWILFFICVCLIGYNLYHIRVDPKSQGIPCPKHSLEITYNHTRKYPSSVSPTNMTISKPICPADLISLSFFKF